MDFAILLPIPDEAIAKGKKEGGEEQKKKGGDIGKKGALYSSFEYLASDDEGN